MWINDQTTKSGFCIYINTICQGPIPVEHDGKGNTVVYETELEAQREIAELTIERLQQFLDGERDFEDAMTVEEYVLPVDVYSDGTVVDMDGNSFSPDRR